MIWQGRLGQKINRYSNFEKAVIISRGEGGGCSVHSPVEILFVKIKLL